MQRLVIVMAFILVLAGCSTGEVTGTDDGPAEGDDGVLTLQDFIPGAADFDEANAEQHWQQQEREVQEQIAACMAEQGFEYVPYVPNQDSFGFGADFDEEEWAAEYGFGIATTMLEEREMEQQWEEEQANDPNFAITEAMSEAERQAYYAALHGPEPDIDWETMSEDEIDEFFSTWEPDGCQNRAYEEAYDTAASQAFYEEFGEAIEEMYQGLDDDPRIVDLEAEWSQCMGEEGYNFTDQWDVEVYLLHRLEEVGAIYDLDIDGEGGGYGYGMDEIAPGGAVEAGIMEVADEERAIAVASLACRGDIDDVRQQVYEEAQQQFIEDHLAELEQFKADNS